MRISQTEKTMSDRKLPDVEAVTSPPRRSLRYEHIETSDEPIGRGGQAVVYEGRVTDEEPPDRIALKEPPRAGTLTGDAIERFLSEAQRWETVDGRERNKQRWTESEHIVGVVDTGDRLPWIAIEYMGGGTLADRLDASDGGLGLPHALWIGESLCRGLAVAHAYGIVHLDLKPANVLFRETAVGTWDLPKIGDWGLSRVLSEQTGTMDGLSVAYAAPEQFESDEFGDPDTLTDVYQAGAIVYALLTGEPPYTGSQTGIMHDIVYGDPPTPPSEYRDDVTEAIDAVVLTALETEKRSRYESVQLFERALHAVRSGGRLPTIIAERVEDSGGAPDRERRRADQSGGSESDRDEQTSESGRDHHEESDTTAQRYTTTVLAIVDELTDSGERTVSSETVAEHVEGGRQSVLDRLDELKQANLVEYTSDGPSGYRPTQRGVERAKTIEVDVSRTDQSGESDDREGDGSQHRASSVGVEAVYEAIRERSRRGTTPVSSVELSRDLDASRGAVLDALDDLKDDGRVAYRSDPNGGYHRTGSRSSVERSSDRGSTVSSSQTATVEYLNDEVVADRGWDPQSGRAFTRSAASDLPPEDYGTIEVERDEYVLEAAEAAGLDWPFSCRAGACTNCAAVVVDGEIDMEIQQILSDEEVEQEDMVLTCIGTPASDHVKLLYNVKHRDRLQNRVI